MSETATVSTAPPPEQPGKPAPNNEMTIPREYDDAIWELLEKGLKSKEIQAKLLLLGCVCKRDALRRRIKRLGRERLTEQQGFSMLQEAIEKGREAVLRRAELEDELDTVADRIMVALRKGDKERMDLLSAASRQLLASLRRYDRQIDQAGKAIVEAEARVAAAVKAEKDRVWREKLSSVYKDIADANAAVRRGDRASSRAARTTPNDVPGEQQPAASPSTSKPPDGAGGAAPPPPGPPSPPPPPSAAPAAAAESRFYDFTLPPATFTFPADGAVLRKKPDSYSGKAQPNGLVMVTVADNKFGPVPVNEHGVFRVLGAKVLGLKSGQHRATVTPMSKEGKRGRTTSIVFTLQLLFLLLLPQRSFAHPISLSVNMPISSPLGLARPPFDVLRGAAACKSDPNLPMVTASPPVVLGQRCRGLLSTKGLRDLRAMRRDSSA